MRAGFIILKTFMQHGSRRNLLFISISQFGISCSFNFINVFLPFYIFKISIYSFQNTLLWVGAIVGSTHLCFAIMSTFWGSLTHRFSPKLLFLRGIIANSAMFLLMGLTTNLYILLILRILQGMVGSISTIGLIIVSSSSPKEKISSDIGFYQSSITFGLLVGPLLGSLAVGILGYKGAFVGASAMLFVSFIFCHLYVTDVPRLQKETGHFGLPIIDRRIIMGWILCFTAQIQIMFLPSVLPNVFEEFKIEQTLGLKLAGTVVMLCTATAMIGIYIWSRLSRKYGPYKIITLIAVSGIILQSLLAFSIGIIDFTVIRMVQTGLVAAVIPLVISIFAIELKGRTIGFLNSARFVGNALGPILATSVLAFSSLTTLYFFIGGITLLAFLGFKSFLKPLAPKQA